MRRKTTSLVILAGLLLGTALLAGYTEVGQYPRYHGVELGTEERAAIDAAIELLKEQPECVAIAEAIEDDAVGEYCAEIAEYALAHKDGITASTVDPETGANLVVLGTNIDWRVMQNAFWDHVWQSDGATEAEPGGLSGALEHLAGVLVHEQTHRDQEYPSEYEAFVASHDAYCKLAEDASAEGTPDGHASLVRICQLAQSDAEHAAAHREAEADAGEEFADPAVPPCHLCEKALAGSGGDDGAWGGSAAAGGPHVLPSTVPVPPSSPRYRAFIQSIPSPDEFVPGVAEFHPSSDAQLSLAGVPTRRAARYAIVADLGELHVDRWNPHAVATGEPNETALYALGFRPTAVTGSSERVLFISGLGSGGGSILRRYDVAVDAPVLTVSETAVPVPASLGALTALVLVPGEGRILGLDASRGRLWMADLSTGDTALLASPAGIPELIGRRSLAGFFGTGGLAEARYVLGTEFPGARAVAAAPRLLVYDLNVLDAQVDGYTMIP